MLRLDPGCGSSLAIWRLLARRDPVNLTITPARGAAAGRVHGRRRPHRTRVAAARALEHLSLGWAWVGWTLRLPGTAESLQL